MCYYTCGCYIHPEFEKFLKCLRNERAREQTDTIDNHTNRSLAAFDADCFQLFQRCA